MLRRARRGSLARRRWASQLTSFHGALGAGRVAERRGVAHEQVEQGHRIGARPFAARPGLVPADRARAGEPDQRAPAAAGGRRPTAPRPRPPSMRKLPSGKVASIRPSTRPASIRSSMLVEAAARTAARASPPPVAKPRSAATRCRPALQHRGLQGDGGAESRHRNRVIPAKAGSDSSSGDRPRQRDPLSLNADKAGMTSYQISCGSLVDLPGLALGDERLEVGRLAGGGVLVLLAHRAFEGRARDRRR